MHRQLELNEARRSEILASLGVDFHTPQNRFDNITALVKSIFGVGLSTVSIIEGDMAYFMSRAGDWAPGAPRKMTLCQCLSACNDSKLLVVENVQMDPRWVGEVWRWSGHQCHLPVLREGMQVCSGAHLHAQSTPGTVTECSVCPTPTFPFPDL